MRTLLIDNYDSFTFNLFHLLGEVNGDEPIVVRNDELSWDEVAALAVDNVVISPGPGRPEQRRDVGVSLDVLRRAEVPVLGVCLGHQALAHVTGGAIDHAPTVMHGRLSEIHHDGHGLFAGIPQGFAAVRYHSLAVDAVPATLRVTAWTPEEVVMGLAHRSRPLWGVQFHPESISTEHGGALLRNFRDLTYAQRRRSSRAARPAARTTAGPRVHHRTLTAWRDPEAVFVALYGDRDHAVWLDSARAEPGLARFSFMGAPDGPLGQVVRYDVATGVLSVDRAGEREELRETRARLLRARADPPAGRRPRAAVRLHLRLRRLSRLRAQGRARRHARAPLPAAGRRARLLRPADRVRPRRAPRPPARAGRCDRRRRRRGLAGDHRAPARRPRPAGAARAGRARGADLRGARGARRLPGQHRRLPARDRRGRDLRGVPDHRAAQRRRDRSARRVSLPAGAQPRTVCGAAAPGRRLGAQLLARALPARRPRADRRVEADQGHRPARRPPRSRTRTAPPRCATTTSRAPRTS